MMPEAEAQPPPSINEVSEKVLLSIPETSPDDSENSDPVVELCKERFRGVLRPLVYAQFHQGETPPAQTFRSILERSVSSDILIIPDELKAKITEQYLAEETQPITDWFAALNELSTVGMAHPLNQLSQIVYSQLPDTVKTELTKATLNS